MADELPLFLCTDYDEVFGSEGCHGVWVRAEDGQAAANAALPVLNDERERCEALGREPTPVDNVYVLGPVEGRWAFCVVERAEVAELQCCGGRGRGSEHLHSGVCPEVVDAEVVEESPEEGIDGGGSAE